MNPLSMDTVDQVEELFRLHGKPRAVTPLPLQGETVGALAHALQCAQLAEWAAAPDRLVAAALLHDIGHLVAPPPGLDRIDDVHELRALGLLASAFDAEVIEPIRLHVQAKRYLVAVDAAYVKTLSPAALRSLALQGGPMNADEVAGFEALPHAAQAVTLRCWDDASHQPGRRTPPLNYYLDLLRSVQQQRRSPGTPRLAIGALDVA